MKQKLLIVADTYYPKVDGTLRFIEEFTKRVEAVQVSLLVPDLGMQVGKNVTYVQPSRYFSMSGYPSIALCRKNIQKIKASIRDSDLVFIQGPALMSYLSMYYGQKYGKKTVFFLHVLSWELFAKFVPRLIAKPIAWLVRYVSLKFYNHCDLILVPYPELRDSLREQGVRVPIKVAQLGVDIHRFVPTTSKRLSKKNAGVDNKLVIGYVGRISKEKNTQVLLEAFHKLKRQDRLALLMVGDGPKRQVEVFQTVSNCRVTGFVNNVQDYLQAMDIFVMPSLTETTSLATLEAMSCGLPVIATRVGFMKQYIVKDKNGLFFPRNSAATLTIKLQQLLHNPELRRRLGENARKTIAYSFSWDRSINRIIRLLQRV